MLTKKNSAFSCIKDELSYYKQIFNEFQLIMDTTFDLITIADNKGYILKTSKSCEALFGVSQSEIIGVNAIDLEEKGILTKSVTLSVLDSKRKETLVQNTAGGRTLMVTGMPMFDDNQNLVRIINISRDITDIESLNKQLNEAEEQLEWVQREIRKKQAIDEKFIVGNSEAMKKIIDLIHHIANVDATILLLGETGVGKGLLAKTIHQMSYRLNRPFIQINCGAIPENLLESELFGYEEGAFTGASKKGKKGLLELAGDGTVFLDEIGELSLQLQVKLLHVLQDKMIYRIGGSNDVPVKARIITATNKDLEKLIAEGKFRQDLYYRLNVMPITIPPLRNRREDIPILINIFLSKFNNLYNKSINLTRKANNILLAYKYPGNVRELENIIERLVLTCHEHLIDDKHITEIIKPTVQSDIELRRILPLKYAKKELERQLFQRALKEYKTTRKIAQALEIDQSTVVKKLKGLNQNDDFFTIK